MGYVIAAYGLVLGSLALYAGHLVRERAALRRALSKSASPGRKANPG